MLLVLAGASDAQARSLVVRWSAHDARLLTCVDLSTRGWRYVPGQPDASRLMVDGEVVSAQRIRGMVIRLPAILPRDVSHIAFADREYAAAEMTAFLAAWLLEAQFPVVNRPLPACLTRPNWRIEQWHHAAALVGVKPVGTFPVAGDSLSVTVVGSRCIGEADEALCSRTRRIADHAGVEFLTVRFSGARDDVRFVEALPYPDVSRDQVADALLDLLLQSTVNSR